MTEIEMLRAFYASWVSLHKIPRDKLHRNKQEAAAQALVDQAHELAEFYQSAKAQERQAIEDLHRSRLEVVK